jgi:hypothetical protein
MLRHAMFFTYRRVNRISVLPALATVASVAILVGVAAIMVVAAACAIAVLRGIGAMRLARRSVPFPDHATIEGIVVYSSDLAHQRT